MTDNSLRTAIEQALFTAIQDQPRGVGGQVVSFYGFEDMPLRLRQTIRDEADAVLAVLTDLPETVIERAARWMYDEYTALMPDAWERDEFGREEWRVDARGMLRAAFGGEQS